MHNLKFAYDSFPQFFICLDVNDLEKECELDRVTLRTNQEERLLLFAPSWCPWAGA